MLQAPRRKFGSAVVVVVVGEAHRLSGWQSLANGPGWSSLPGEMLRVKHSVSLAELEDTIPVAIWLTLLKHFPTALPLIFFPPSLQSSQ